MIVNGEKDSKVIIRPEPFTDIYEVHSEIGRGKFAVVKRCVHRSTGVNFAAKFLHKRRRGKDCRHEALHEIHMLHLTAANPRIIDLLEVYETSHDLVLVTEYVSGGELFQHIDMEGRVDEKSTVRLLRQILEGIAFLHSNNILHLDIKPQNILLTDNVAAGDVKLCDLGLARPFNSGTDVIDIVGTLDYVAPEVLDYVSLDASCDMWSVGVLAYVMLTGCSPFAGDSRQETLLNISQVNLEFPPDLFESVSPQAIDFIRKLLVRNTCKRMTAEQSLQHPWLAATTDNHTTTTTTTTTAAAAASDYTTTTACTDSCPNDSAASTASVDCCTTVSAAATASDTIPPTTSIPDSPCPADITPVGPHTSDIALSHPPCPLFRPLPPAPVMSPTTPVTPDVVTIPLVPSTPNVPSTPVTPAASPSLPRCRTSSIYDSPSGQRRALIATLNGDEVLTTHEPAKKCRCDVTDSQRVVRTGVNNKENNAQLDTWSQLCVETVAATELCCFSTTTTTTTTSASCLNVSVA